MSWLIILSIIFLIIGIILVVLAIVIYNNDDSLLGLLLTGIALILISSTILFWKFIKAIFPNFNTGYNTGYSFVDWN
jgi:hypothetical protein